MKSPLTKTPDENDPRFTIYVWIRENPPALVNEGSLPIDYGAWAEITTYKSWEEVADWAQEKHVIPEELPEVLAEKTEEIKSLPTKQEQVTAALRFAQDEIRYLGLFEGTLTHLRYAYKTLDDRVSPERIEDYLKNARRAENNTNYELWITRDLYRENHSHPIARK